MEFARGVQLGSYVVAAVVFFPGALLIVEPIAVVLEPLLRAVGIVLAPLFRVVEYLAPSGGPYRLLIAALPLAVFARAITTRTPADIVLATLAVPCLLLTAVSHYGRTTGGVNWGDAVMLVAGTVLAVAVLGDAVLARVARTRA